jgi:hypothetical protein
MRRASVKVMLHKFTISPRLNPSQSSASILWKPAGRFPYALGTDSLVGKGHVWGSEND